MQPGRSRSNPSNAVPDENVQGVMAMGSDQPLIKAVASAPPSLVEELADAAGTSNVGDVAGCESGVIPRVSVPAVTSWDQAGLEGGTGPTRCGPFKSD
ncbi:hypothetical protein Nepgr_015834 [Nepenthes gracilis]|uniref:Uncharacterized protein n=1 Tax=Nepenthes gracilis TaxID=150966 RepID=A0AAD3XR26_NEPGR|nr:hypothetical protein Nepgr_015834 [Nepenthes gracilis]